MSGLQCGLGSPTAQNAIRAMFPGGGEAGDTNASVHEVQKGIKNMAIKEEKGSAAPKPVATISAGPKALVIAGPSGVGKGTLIEENGVHYHFVEKEAMEKEIADGKFIEHANVHGNLYGTSKAAVETVAKAGKICILDIDVQGCRSVRRAGLAARFVFIAPPSYEELERRLRGRGTETEDKIVKRLAGARSELDAKDEPGLFDHIVVNDDLEHAYQALCALLKADIGGIPAAATAGPKALVVAGPSGVGKGTLIEEDGVHYHFATRETMEAAIGRGEFIEHADVHGNLYGTSKAAVETVARSGKICILDIDVQGCRSVRRAGLAARFVFIAPPSFEELERRLRGRGTETEDKIVKRLAGARSELDAKDEPGLFDHIVVNDDLEHAYQEVVKIIEADIKAVAATAAR